MSSNLIGTLPLFAGLVFYLHLPAVIVVVSLVYAATRYDDWGAILHEAWRWGLRLACFLMGVVVVLFLVMKLT